MARIARVLAPVLGFRVECRVKPGVRRTWRWKAGLWNIRSVEMEVIPDSFVLITIVLAIPVVGIVAALVDLDEERLAETKAAVEAMGRTVSTSLP